jgi:CRP-like cAMP-binding protein
VVRRFIHGDTASSDLMVGLSWALFAALLVIAIEEYKTHRSSVELTRRTAPKAPLPADPFLALQQVTLFQSLAAPELRELAQTCEPVELHAGRVVFREDEPADAFYVVLSGALEISKRWPAPWNGSGAIGRVGPGDSFGEIALLENTVRTATVRTLQPCRLLRLSRDEFARLVAGRVGISQIRENLQHGAFLRRMPWLSDWPEALRLSFAHRFRSVRYAAGEVVLKKGRANRHFYLIYDGTFEVRAGDTVLRRLRPGEHFGEISLLEDGVATVDVVAGEESRCLVLGRSDFVPFFAQDFRLGLHLQAIAEQRLGGAHPTV